MAWIPIAAWIAALVVALVLLGYCAYEIAWKAKRDPSEEAERGSCVGIGWGEQTCMQSRVG